MEQMCNFNVNLNLLIFSFSLPSLQHRTEISRKDEENSKRASSAFLFFIHSSQHLEEIIFKTLVKSRPTKHSTQTFCPVRETGWGWGAAVGNRRSTG